MIGNCFSHAVTKPISCPPTSVQSTVPARRKRPNVDRQSHRIVPCVIRMQIVPRQLGKLAVRQKFRLHVAGCGIKGRFIESDHAHRKVPTYGSSAACEPAIDNSIASPTKESSRPTMNRLDLYLDFPSRNPLYFDRVKLVYQLVSLILIKPFHHAVEYLQAEGRRCLGNIS